MSIMLRIRLKILKLSSECIAAGHTLRVKLRSSTLSMYDPMTCIYYSNYLLPQAKKIDGPACVQQFAKQWSDLINHTKCTPTFDTDYRPEYDPANISHGKHANERLVEGPRSTKRKKNRRNKAPTQPEAKPENPIAPATQSRGSHDPANMISSLTLPLGIPAEFPQFWTEETSDPEIDREVELFTRKLEDHSKAIASTDGKTIKICLRQQSYEQLAGWSRTHSMNMFKHLYQLPGQ